MKYLDITNEELVELGLRKHEEYIHALPFPNIYFDHFFNEDFLNQVLNEFPDLVKKPSIKYNDPNQVKLASNTDAAFGELTRPFMHYLNSAPFLDFLSALTGIKNLIPDPYFLGGGYHQILPGGYLKIHADFNKHPENKLDRRLNVLIYLNKDWREEYGGHFQLWDKDMKGSEAKILPLFNRLAIFSTTDYSYHGHPDPLTCPPDRSRRSIALYYYTNGRPVEEINPNADDHPTLFKYRKGEDDMSRRQQKLIRFINLTVPPILIKAASNIKRRLRSK